jgi:hypothetical protein
MSNEDGSYQEKAYRLEKRKFWVEVGTLFLVFAYATIAALQWCAMRDANNETREANAIARQSMQVSQRAYVSVSSIELRCPKETLIQFKNVGQMPATDVEVKVTEYLHIYDPDIRGAHMGQTNGPWNYGNVPVLFRESFPLFVRVNVTATRGVTSAARCRNFKAGRESIMLLIDVSYGDGFVRQEQRIGAYRYDHTQAGWKFFPASYLENWDF